MKNIEDQENLAGKIALLRLDLNVPLKNKDILDDLTVVVSKHQTKGRGRNGNVWSNEPSLNLAFSIYKRFSDLEIDKKFMLNVITSISVYKTLEKNGITKKIGDQDELVDHLINDLSIKTKQTEKFTSIINNLSNKTYIDTIREINKFLKNEVI